LACIVIGLPVWFVVGILIALSHKFFPEILASTGVKVDPDTIKSFSVATPEMVMWSYVGLSTGDLLSGLLSQLFKSRKKVIYLNLMGIAAMTLVYLYGPTGDQNYYRFIAFSLGAVTGYWAIFVTNASEQFGTNIRSTVAATVPNFVRGGVLLITMGFEYFSQQFQANQSFDGRTFSVAALIVGAVCLILAFWGTYNVEEAFHKDLDYFEHDAQPTDAKNNA
jgi:hypothetical protein